MEATKESDELEFKNAHLTERQTSMSFKNATGYFVYLFYFSLVVSRGVFLL
jgi:hypothetical protein